MTAPWGIVLQWRIRRSSVQVFHLLMLGRASGKLDWRIATSDFVVDVITHIVV
jgi:hypothetical protein